MSKRNAKPGGDATGDDDLILERLRRHLGFLGLTRTLDDCEIHSIAITETSRSRSPKTIDGDHRKRSIAIGGPTGAAQIPGRSRGDQRVPAGLTPQ
jgi:hypothetical protein